MKHISQQEQEKIAEVVRSAGLKILTLWKKDDTSGVHLKVEAKADGSNVTNADIASNETIIAGLQAIFPSDRILSEEITPEADIDSAERVWVIDPLDGTQSFIEGRDDFSVLLALTVNKCAVFSICYFPARDIFCTALKGGATSENNQRIACSSFDTPRPEKVYVRDCEVADPTVKFPKHVDSGLAFLMIARGELDGAVIRIKRLKQWDLAALAALIIGAGGKVSDESGSDILYSAHSFHHRYFVASNGHCHERLLQQIVE
jgi:myo-inositol-1(or 4)-monophosphatase